MWGIDVSHHQGSINWQKVAAHGVQYAIMKAMYETSHRIDEKFNYNYEQAGKCGIERGAYVYNIATSVALAEKEANDFVKVLGGKKLERGIWLDMEDAKIKKLGKVLLTQIIEAEAAIFKAAGYKVGIYCNKDWYYNVLDSANLKNTYPFWIARYPASDTGVPEMSLKPATYGIIWQYSSKGTVDGISTKVDMDCDLADMGKTVDVVVKEVIAGNWGNGEIRKNRLIGAGYDYDIIQKEVNKALS